MLVHRYNEEEWNNVIAKDPAWSREETDYLLDLCEALDLRFLVIADRYEVHPFGGSKCAPSSIKLMLDLAREGKSAVSKAILTQHCLTAGLRKLYKPKKITLPSCFSGLQA